MNLAEAKRALRAQMRKLLAEAAADETLCRARSLAAGKAVTGSPLFGSANIILAFYPMKTEIDTRTILETALMQGKRLALPRVNGGEIDFYFIDAAKPLTAQTAAHPYGMLEPLASLERFMPATAESENILILTPGLAFSARGERLGHGKGFYDRFLAKLPAAALAGTGQSPVTAVCGLCYGFQIRERLPVDSGDRPVTFLASEQGLFPCPAPV